MWDHLTLAEQRNADAQDKLGWMYYKGQGVPQDDKTAVKSYRLAAEQGHSHYRRREDGTIEAI